MKKLLHTLSFVFCFAVIAKAQYVNIPDTNFGSFLIAKYPACLYKDTSNKYWMDTTCGAVVNDTTLICNNWSINSIEGIKYFSNLTWLDCSSNNITNIPTLPKTLNDFRCARNKITYLPYLNDNLVYFDGTNNQIYSFQNFPKAIAQFWIDSNKNLSSIPSLDSAGINCINYGFGVNISLTNTSVTCIPHLPNRDPVTTHSTYIIVDSGYVKCIPNVSTSHIIFVKGIGMPVVTILPICNPTNNPNQCTIYPSISGKVFTDNNSNALKDSLEFYRPFVKLTLSNGQSTYSNLQGNYIISVDTFATYTLKVTPPPFYKAVPDSVNVTFTPGSPSIILPDIALQPTVIKDSFAIKVTSLNRPRPGFKYAVNLTYGNVGTVNSASNNYVLLNYDTSKLMFDSASVPVTHYTINNAPVVFNPGILAAGQGGSFNVYFRVKTTAAIGDTLKNLGAIIYSLTKAINLDSVIIINSYDPNDKQATPQLTQQQVQNGEAIDYIVRFQNVGTASAVNVVIADTLSSLLQYNQIQVLSSSHNAAISYSLANGIVYFEFFNINLPAANVNEPLSHGFVRFKIKPLNSLAVGAVVENKAHIYFDYNAPVITNTATTLIKNTIVPVKLLNYQLQLKTDNATNSSQQRIGIQNLWSVGTEINTSHYIVERSIDGKTFVAVGEVAANGSSNYSFVDNQLNNYIQPTTLYYRLKMVDKDGKFVYSMVKFIAINNSKNSFSIMPNPAKDNVVISATNAKQITITNSLGKIVWQQNVSTNTVNINTQNFVKGVYVVTLRNANNETKVEKLIIE